MNFQNILISSSEKPGLSKIYFGLIAISVYATGLFLSLIQPGHIEIDGGIFTAIALKDLGNGTLYVDAWENKPPGIFLLLKIFFVLIPNSIYAVFTLTFLTFLITSICLYLLFTVFFGSIGLSIIFSVIALFFTFNKNNIGDGLYTEIYGTLCILLALISIEYLKDKYIKLKIPMAGVFLGMSFWFKEPFIMLVIPLFILVIYRFKGRNDRLRFILYASLPSVCILLYLFIHGSFYAFFEMMMYNFSYISSGMRIPFEIKILDYYNYLLSPILGIFVLFLYMAFGTIKDKKTRIESSIYVLLLFCTSAFVFAFPYNLGHYYFPSFVLLFPIIAKQYQLFVISQKRTLKWPFLLVCFYAVYSIDKKAKPILNYQIQDYKKDRITSFLEKKKDKTLFVDYVIASPYYIKSGLQYPTFLPVALPVHFEENKLGLMNRNKIWQNLKDAPPDYLITTYTNSYFSWFLPETDYYVKNYEKIDSLLPENDMIIYLWQNKNK